MSFELESINSYILPLLGLIVGYFLPRKTRSKSNHTVQDHKLEQELQQDRIKQLEAKVKTLEKALELSQK